MDKAIQVCTEMLSDRGYVLNKKDENVFYFINKQLNDNLILFINILPKLNINSVKDYISFLEQEKITHGVIIYNNVITSSAKKIILNLFNKSIERFSINELQFNITTHKYYNLHTKLNDREKQRFIENIGMKIPILRHNDPVSRYYYFKKGDIIKVHRKNNYISYRIVK